jgi:hypothetical protein
MNEACCPAGAFSLVPLAADALDVVAELTEAGIPPSLAELAYELDAEDEAVRDAVATIRTMGFVELFSDLDGIARWRALLRVRPRPQLEIVGTFDAPALTATICGSYADCRAPQRDGGVLPEPDMARSCARTCFLLGHRAAVMR